MEHTALENVEVKMEDTLSSEEGTSNGCHMDCSPDVLIKSEPPDINDHTFDDSSQEQVAEIDMKRETEDNQFAPSEDNFILPDHITKEASSSESKYKVSSSENDHQALVNIYDAQPDCKSESTTQSNEEQQSCSPTPDLDSMLNFEVEENSQPRSRRKQILKPIEDVPESDQTKTLDSTEQCPTAKVQPSTENEEEIQKKCITTTKNLRVILKPLKRDVISSYSSMKENESAVKKKKSEKEKDCGEDSPRPDILAETSSDNSTLSCHSSPVFQKVIPTQSQETLQNNEIRKKLDQVLLENAAIKTLLYEVMRMLRSNDIKKRPNVSTVSVQTESEVGAAYEILQILQSAGFKKSVSDSTVSVQTEPEVGPEKNIDLEIVSSTRSMVDKMVSPFRDDQPSTSHSSSYVSFNLDECESPDLSSCVIKAEESTDIGVEYISETDVTSNQFIFASTSGTLQEHNVDRNFQTVIPDSHRSDLFSTPYICLEVPPVLNSSTHKSSNGPYGSAGHPHMPHIRKRTVRRLERVSPISRYDGPQYVDHQELVHLQIIHSGNRVNFVRALTRMIFKHEEMVGKNARGMSNSNKIKLPLDETKMKFLEYTTFKAFPLTSSDFKKEYLDNWGKCLHAVNDIAYKATLKHSAETLYTHKNQ